MRALEYYSYYIKIVYIQNNNIIYINGKFKTKIKRYKIKL